MGISTIKDTAYTTSDIFKEDVLKGLGSSPKYLQSKYFYDKRGDKLFQEIMESEQYYLTDAEMEIFSNRCKDMLQLTDRFEGSFDLIELGAGDALKSTELLKCLSAAKKEFTYYPIDISSHIIHLIERELPKKVSDLKIQGIAGDYFEGLKKAKEASHQPKLVLFLGGNIGNMPPEEALKFCSELHNHLNKGDLVLIGFDMKKNPWTIFNAYNDQEGITKKFNLNLLERIKRELGANIRVELFDHYESYDPETGACKSYLFSLEEQTAEIDGVQIHFRENEYIFMETSHKYTLTEIEDMALKSNFNVVSNLTDSRNWFTDSVWEVI